MTTKEEVLAKIQEIGTTESETDRRELLAQLSDVIGADYDNFTETTKQVEQLTTDNETLRSANMKLFLRVGGKKPEESIKDTTGADPESKEEKLEYKNLFDDKGELKL
jgi:regulator of replication initiation timing